jgi:hypothetical protein
VQWFVLIRWESFHAMILFYFYELNFGDISENTRFD